MIFKIFELQKENNYEKDYAITRKIFKFKVWMRSIWYYLMT